MPSLIIMGSGAIGRDRINNPLSRFIPVINDVGKSFLTLDKFLNEGKMHHIKF
jgi:hypothetical protein